MIDQEVRAARTRPESLAAVRLLQGVVYSSDAKAWDQVLIYRSNLEDYFGRIGLVLVVAEDDGLAYLRQRSDDERDADGDSLPRLLRRTPLTYDVTLLCVILRDELRRFENEDLDNTRPTVALDSLFPMWKSMQPTKYDDVKCRETLASTMRKLEQMAFLQKFGGDEEYEIRMVLKARLPIELLGDLRNQMKGFIESQS